LKGSAASMGSVEKGSELFAARTSRSVRGTSWSGAVERDRFAGARSRAWKRPVASGFAACPNPTTDTGPPAEKVSRPTAAKGNPLRLNCFPFVMDLTAPQPLATSRLSHEQRFETRSLHGAGGEAPYGDGLMVISLSDCERLQWALDSAWELGPT
jgi:hypothetical protein